MAKPSDPHEDLKKFLRQLGIDPASVTVVMPKEPLGGAERPANDNVIPFPKSSNPRGGNFGQRGNPRSAAAARPSVRDILMRAVQDIDNHVFDPDAVVLIQVERGPDNIINAYTGLNRFEVAGLLHDVAHDVLVGSFHSEDPTDGAA